jgi:hypothetical protein
MREFLVGQGAIVTRYQDGIPPPAPGQVNLMIVASGHVMLHGLEGTQLALPRYLVQGMHVVTELFMQKVMASPGQVRLFSYQLECGQQIEQH